MSEEPEGGAEQGRSGEADPRIAEATPLVHALLEAAAAAMGPALGVELESGEVEVDVEDGPPEGELAVLPVTLARDEVRVASVEVVSPLDEIVAFARKVNGAEQTEDKDEIGDEDVSAIGELLALLGDGVREAVHASVDPELVAQTGEWWRSDDPGERGFAPGQCVIGAGVVTIPGGPSSNLFFRLSPGLLSDDEAAEEDEPAAAVLLLDLDDALRDALTPALQRPDREVHAVTLEDENLDALLARAVAIFVSAEREDHGALCRKLRVHDDSWRAAIVLCVAEPTRDAVVAALHDGASGVLKVPAQPDDVTRVLAAAALPA